MSQVTDFRIPQRWKRDLRATGVLCSAERYPIVSYPLGSIGPIFRDPLKMRPIGCPETSVRNCHCSVCNPEERRSQNVTRFHSTNGNVASCMACSKTGLSVLLKAQWLLQVHLCVQTHCTGRTVCTVHTYTYSTYRAGCNECTSKPLLRSSAAFSHLCLWLRHSTFSLK